MLTALRRLTAVLAFAGLLTGVACGSASTPSVTPATTAKPLATTAPPPKPAEPSSAGTKPAPGVDWKTEWDKTVAAAQKEGTVVVAGAPGDLYRKAMAPFQKAYPDIKLDYTGQRGVDFTPKITAERNGGQYLWDAYIGGWITPLPLIPMGVFDPLTPALLLPEVLDDAKWLGGFADGWVDKGHQFEFEFQSRLEYVAMVNRDIVPESELSTVDQLLDPKWKGKIASLDPRGVGPLSAFLGYLAGMGKGEDWVRKLFAQDLVVLADGRQVAEAVMRGRYPIAMAVPSGDIEQLKQEGLGANVKPLAPDAADGRRLTSGFGNVMLVNKAPHPNAARVYINWLLSQEGQKAWVEATAQNSRRLDVPGPAATAPKPNVKYELKEREGSPLEQSNVRVITIAREMIR